MTGVEILAAQEIVTSYAWNWIAYLITVAALAVGMGLVGLFSGYHLSIEDFMFGFVIGAAIGLFVGILPAVMTKPAEYETQYKVIISDEVQMNEFLSRYEILSQEGKIYTVRSLEETND